VSTVFTAGTFDLLHPGHVWLFEQCRRIAGPDGEVKVSVNTSEFVAQFKAPPVQTFDERYQMVKAIKYVDEVLRNDSEDLTDLLYAVRPDFLVIGSDWAQKDYHAQISAPPRWLATHGITLLYIDRWSPHSSTELKERIRES
jgi:cytidyltransferase-like protein